MKYIGMIIGGVLSAIGHMFAFMFKNIYISIRRFSLDPANKNVIWNLQAFGLLGVFLLSFFWLIGKYQDLLYGSEPVFFRAIPLLLPCFLGHIIYSCPALFKNTYAKPIIQTLLNSISALALGQIILRFIPLHFGLIIAVVIFVASIVATLYYTLNFSVKRTVFNKLLQTVEEAEMQLKSSSDKSDRRDHVSGEELSVFEGIDLNELGCLSHLRYYSKDCRLELFTTVPTKERQSQLIVLKRNDRGQHSQYIGGTGAGKTLLATNHITQDLLNDAIGSTVVDPKGSLINRLANFLDRTGRPYYRLDPEYEFTDCFNPFFVPDGRDIEPMIEANISAFHGYLGPDSEQYFKSRSSQLMRVGIKALKLVYGNDCTYNELNQLIQPLNDDFRAEVLSKLLGREDQVPLLREYTKNMSGNAKMQEHTMQTYSNLYDYLSELTSNKFIQRIFCGPSTFNIDDVLKDGEVVLVNGAYGTLQTLTYTVGRLYLNLLRASTFRRNIKEEVTPHQLTVDEIEMFADEEFSTFMEMAREFEVFVSVIHQGNEQLNDVSRRLGAMVKQNAVQKYILAGLEPEDAEYYADLMGEDYKIGLSSGTDEMSTSGFKTQIKEEKRYAVMPSEILRLKGYNPETGDPGECMFRGVSNNVRMDPVIGLVYPLPKVLFSPLKNKVTVENIIETEEEISEALDEEIITRDYRLERIKLNANKQREEKQVESEKSNEAVVSKTEQYVSRNKMWDSEGEVVAAAENTQKNSRIEVKFSAATIDNTALKLAQRVKDASELKRIKKENSEAE
ncbi:MAG: type IV secretory system conjugative DNA transfer family protein [Candidatus Pristimantibacillus sp.]